MGLTKLNYMKTTITSFVSRIIFFVIFLFLLSDLAIAQSEIPEISFIKLNNKIGIVLDSVKNDQCKCVTYYDKEEYNYSTLIQLPDSNIVLRIQLKGNLGSRDINMDTTEIKKLYTSALTFTSQLSVIDSIKEEEILRSISGDTVLYKRIDYNSLKYPTNIKPIHGFVFFNTGLGLGNFRGNSNILYGLESGYVFKNNMLLSLHFYNENEWQFLSYQYPSESVYDLGLLVGYKVNLDRIAISFSGGISKVSGVVRGAWISTDKNGGWLFADSYYQALNFNTLGFPIQAELFLGARRGFNISLIWFHNFNSDYPYSGFLVCMRFGEIQK